MKQRKTKREEDRHTHAPARTQARVRVMTKAVWRQQLMAETRVQSQAVHVGFMIVWQLVKFFSGYFGCSPSA